MSPFLAAATWLVGLELVWGLARGALRFAVAGDVLAFVGLSWLVLAGGCVFLGTAGREVVAAAQHGPCRSRSRGWTARRLGGATAMCVVPFAAWVLWELSSGRRLRALAGREVAVVAGALTCGAVLGRLATVLVRAAGEEAPRRRRFWAGSLLMASLAAMLADAWLLPRLYRPMHVGLAAAAVASGVTAFGLLSEGDNVPSERDDAPGAWRRRGGQLGVGLMAAAAGVLALVALRASPSLRFMAEQAAPLQGKLLAALRAVDPQTVSGPRGSPAPASAAEAASTAPGSAGPDLRGSDVLLVTVDALRADRLAAYGGDGIAPEMDALAEQAVVFERAYTPSPHTSYALVSLFTGTFARATVEMGSDVDARPTLPELLEREGGYATAGFFPPAVFYVDGTHFASLRERRFGFEHVQMNDASAEVRARQLQAFLRDAPQQPLFVWTHLFEPHEPYEPPPGLIRGKGTAARYDGEVRAADRAIGTLVKAFRRERPGALVILTADHGEELGDHGGAYHGTTLFDEQIRVPLLWSAPGRLDSERVARPAELVDVTTTLLSVLGVPVDARMHGDDLSATLRGATASRGVAVAQLPERRMAYDGRFKVICRRGERGCALFDLARDPHERRNVADLHPRKADRLQGSLSRWTQRIARLEHLEAASKRWSRVLARARLGDHAVAPRVVPFLASKDASIRKKAARACAELEHAGARAALGRLAATDPDPEVRAEAVLAGLALGDSSAAANVRAWLEDAAVTNEGWRRRAALELARRGDASGFASLIAWCRDEEATFDSRREAVRALGTLGAPDAVPVLGSLLREPSLAVAAAEALGAIGGRRAARVLARRIPAEPYPLAREAQLAALARIAPARAARIKRRRGRTKGRSTHVAGASDHGASARARAAQPGAADRAR